MIEEHALVQDEESVEKGFVHEVLESMPHALQSKGFGNGD